MVRQPPPPIDLETDERWAAVRLLLADGHPLRWNRMLFGFFVAIGTDHRGGFSGAEVRELVLRGVLRQVGVAVYALAPRPKPPPKRSEDLIVF